MVYRSSKCLSFKRAFSAASALLLALDADADELEDPELDLQWVEPTRRRFRSINIMNWIAELSKVLLERSVLGTQKGHQSPVEAHPYA